MIQSWIFNEDLFMRIRDELVNVRSLTIVCYGRNEKKYQGVTRGKRFALFYSIDARGASG